MKSIEIKELLKKEQIPYWKIGDAIGLSENTVWRKLCREEISDDMGNQILQAIEEIKKGA